MPEWWISWWSTRSTGLPARLFDFAKIVETLDAPHRLVRVGNPVLQHHNLHGPADLNVLLSFAQFERRLPASASATSSPPPRSVACGWAAISPGYDLKDRKLVINKKEAETVTTIFRLYVDLGAVRKVKPRLIA